MRISVPTETAPREQRVALAPDSVATTDQAAKTRSGGSDAAPACGPGSATAPMKPPAPASLPTPRRRSAARRSSRRSSRRASEEIAQIDSGATLISLLRPGHSAELTRRSPSATSTALALELVPRITRAQSMDVLSSQSTVAGYKAVLIGAASLGKFLPMLTTAAGNISPAKVFVIGAGVAGLQAIATGRRLGGVVSAFDVRPAAREQVQSLGASFVANELVSASAEAAGGYARAQTADEQTRTLAAIGNHIKDMDLVVSTAQIPGRQAPTLITDGDGRVDAGRIGDRRSRRRKPAATATLSKAGETVAGARRDDHRAAQFAEHRRVSREPDVRPQHIRAAQTSRSRRRAGARRRRRDHRSNDDDPRWTGAALMEILELYVFVLAAFVGYMVITRVPPLLHTPLMAATNAISGISLVGSLIAAGARTAASRRSSASSPSFARRATSSAGFSSQIAC